MTVQSRLLFAGRALVIMGEVEVKRGLAFLRNPKSRA